MPDESWAELRRLNAELARAEFERDTAALGELLADDFLGVGPTGELLGKRQVIESYGGGRIVFDSIVTQEHQVRVSGDAGVITAVSTLRGWSGGMPFEGRFRYMDVYVRREGRWRLFSSLMTPLGE
ncbi:MAG TPA: nuclear transport factor 2 family protein [Longimicrobiaceae bacterium]|nr:nuclear transport factor 2 family protein [Longimicrobiaceae bacterium]